VRCRTDPVRSEFVWLPVEGRAKKALNLLSKHILTEYLKPSIGVKVRKSIDLSCASPHKRDPAGLLDPHDREALIAADGYVLIPSHCEWSRLIPSQPREFAC
jgi:hypothetical protein